MSDITLVTAFFDIGRGTWSQNVQKNGGPLPHYLKRTTDEYIGHFAKLCTLNNKVIAFTQPDLVDILKSVSQNAHIIPYDYFEKHNDLRQRIERIQTSEAFIKSINPYQVRNPEYWSKDYVGVTSLKSYFVNLAFQTGQIDSKWASWIDFGLIRKEDHLPKSKVWDYDFEEGKIHMFNLIEPKLQDQNKQIAQAVLQNVVYIFGGVIVAERDKWEYLSTEMSIALEQLMHNGLVDDDQGLFLISYFRNPELYKLHKLPMETLVEDVRFILKQFNKYE